jgi:hypothetical protein
MVQFKAPNVGCQLTITSLGGVRVCRSAGTREKDVFFRREKKRNKMAAKSPKSDLNELIGWLVEHSIITKHNADQYKVRRQGDQMSL